MPCRGEVQQEYLQTRANIADQNSQMWGNSYLRNRLSLKKRSWRPADYWHLEWIQQAMAEPYPGMETSVILSFYTKAGFETAEVVQIMSLNGADILGIASETG